MKNYIFGYGSLIEKSSRLRTTPDATKVLPIKIQGFQRGWFARTGVAGLSTTFLGCIEDSNHHVNGVIYEVSQEDLTTTDKREKGYERKEIKFESITFLSKDHTINKEDKIWLYVSIFPDNKIPESVLPSKSFPIVQSYIDICVNGCLEIEAQFKLENFAKDFVTSTTHWSEYWVNDRIYPRRPFIYRPTAYKIDAILKENLPDKDLFNKIYFE